MNITSNINFYYTENIFNNYLNLYKGSFYLDNFDDIILEIKDIKNNDYDLDNMILEIKDIKNDDYDLDNMFLEVKDIKIYQIDYFFHFEIE